MIWALIAACVRSTTTAEPPPTTEPPGPCEPIPDTSFAILEHRSAHGHDRYLDQRIDIEADYRYVLAPLSDVDLDGDGVLDHRVPVVPPDAGTCATKVRWDLYVRRGDCGHFVGQVRGHPVPRPPASGGLSTLETLEEPQGPQDAGVELTWTYDGALFALTQEVRRPARCDVHPSDCAPMTHFTCRLEGR